MVRIKSLSESLSRMDCDRKKVTDRKKEEDRQKETARKKRQPARKRQTDGQTDEVFGGLALPLH